ncbi:MAG TPA: response regulator [Brevundimonas sp.]|jgi:CheY-like chemotaxis protein/PAS domain-containing protein|nr:response regulator [Brevundimonas sp.]
MVEATTDVTAGLGRAWDRLRRPIWLYDPRTGRKPYANPAALALWSVETLDAFRRMDFSPRSPAMKSRLARLVDQASGGAAVSERWTFYPDEAPVTAQALVSVFRTENGEDLLLFEVAPEELQAEERRSVEALRHAAAMISLFEPGGVHLFANPAAYRAYGLGRMDFSARFADAGAAAKMLAAAAGSEVSGVYAVVTAAGPRWHLMDARAVLDPVSGRSCLLLNEQDVTARVEAEMARAAAEQKAAMSEARQRFLTEMSHELRTPLNAVIGFSALLVEAGLDAGAADQVGRIHAAGLRLRDVVNQMIDSPSGATPAPASNRDDADAVAPPGDEGPSTQEGTSGSGGLRVLYVDDNENNRCLVRAMLQAAGIGCETVGDGRAGVAAAAAGGWDVILMDIQMPEMDGIAACRCIRALDGPVAATPIIAVTANTLPEQVQSYLEAGMEDWVGKPVDMIELLGTMTRWARGARA